DAQALNLPASFDTADMVRADLEAARNAWIGSAATPEEKRRREESDFLKADADEGKIDFHALRHAFGTALALAGTPPKVTMDLMRHSDINLTMRLYSHTVVADRAGALVALPDLQPIDREAQATGTDDLVASADGSDPRLALCLAQIGGQG